MSTRPLRGIPSQGGSSSARRSSVRRLPFVLFVTGAVLLTGGPADAQQSPVDTRGLATGPHSTMAAKLDQTFLRIDVARVRIRLDEPTAREVARIVRGQEYSEERAARIARIVSQADDAWVQIEFLRDVGVNRFLDESQADLRSARDAGLIDPRTYRRAVEGVRELEALGDRGFENGGRIVYRVRPESIETVVLSPEGQVLFRDIDRGEGVPRSLLSSFMSPGSDFREGLIKSLF